MTLYKQAIRDDRVREYLPAVRTVMSEGFSKPDFFIGRHAIQSLNTLTDADQINVKKGAYILLDFGMELHGGIRIVTGGGGRGKVRVRFGESVSEAMQTPNQDHSIHDAELELPMMGMMEYGCTGFRFVRIDNAGNGKLQLEYVRAVSLMRPMERLGSFRSSDERLNAVFETAVRTVHLCCQSYLWMASSATDLSGWVIRIQRLCPC
jgi:hypothetical protein